MSWRTPITVCAALLAITAVVSMAGDDGAQQGALELEAQHTPARGPGRVVPGAVFRPLGDEHAQVPSSSGRTALARSAVDVAEGTRVVLVHGPHGEDISAALLEVEGVASRTVYTDAGGRARVALPLADSEDGSARLRVQAAGYRTAVVPIAAADDVPLVVTLEAGGALSGSVLWSNGAAASAGTTVLCWPAGDRPSVDEVLRVRAGGQSDALRVAQTDASGRFRFEGLRLRRDYELGSCCDGGLAVERIHDAQVGASDLLLELEPVVGASLELAAADGAPLRTCEGLFGGPAVWDPADARIGSFHFPDGAAEFAWIGGRELWLASAGGRDRYLMLYKGAELDSLDVAEGTFSIDVPGYEPVWSRFPLEPLSSDLHTRALVLTPDVQCWSSLELELDGVEGWIGARQRVQSRALGTLRLQDPVTMKSFAVALQPSPDGRWSFDQIPCGRYSVSLALRDWSGVIPEVHEPPVFVDIDEQGGRVSLALTGRGAGEVLVASADGSDYEGELVLLVKHGGPARFIRFESAPYVLGGLKEGAYDVSVQRIGHAPANGTPGSELYLAANTVSACMIHLE